MKENNNYIDFFKRLEKHSHHRYEHINLKNWNLYIKYLVEVLGEDIDWYLHGRSPSTVAYEMEHFMEAYHWIKNN